MKRKRVLFLGMVALTLGIGVIVGTIVSGGVRATFEQKPAAIVIPDPVSLSNAFSQIAAQLEPAVVSISVETAAPRNRQGREVRPELPFNLPPGIPPELFDTPEPRPRTGTGTGFIVDKTGYILTNHHVVDEATRITVLLSDKSEHRARLIGSDEGTDLGLIKIDDAGNNLAVAKFGNSDGVKVGDWVLAIGSPYNFDHTVTAGIISAKGRDNSRFGVDQNFRGLQRFLQTDAAINPGNSGGPLVNMSGEVIGVNTAIVSQTASFAGLGFALPSNTAVKVYNQLSQNGKVTRGSIGISYESVTDPVKLESYGIKAREAVIVGQVYEGSPAARAGLQPEDWITEINGTKIASGNQLQDIIVETPVGSSVRLGFVREGKALSASVVVGDRAEVLSETSSASNATNRNVPRSPGETQNSVLGIQVGAISPQLSRQFGLAGGVEITGVDADSVAEDAGLEDGMIITGVITGGARTTINNVADFRRVESRLRPGTAVTLVVRTPPRFEDDIRVPMRVK
jgi:serine protease Do